MTTRTTRRSLAELIKSLNNHHSLRLELYTSIGSAIVYIDGREVAQGRTLRDTEQQVRAFVRGYLHAKKESK